MLVAIPEGWGFIFILKNGNSGEVWGLGCGMLSEIPSMVGVWIFSGTACF